MRHSFVWALLGLLCCNAILAAEDGVELSRATLAARVAELERASDLSGYRDAQSWSEDQRELRQQLIEMLGLPPLETRDPELHPTITGTLETEYIVVEKLYFQSLPGLYVTGNLYRPNRSTDRCLRYCTFVDTAR